MNLFKRACLYSIRKKGKTLTLLAFLLVMATLMLTCLSIQSATETANANIKKALLGYFTINAKTLENGIPEDTVSQILDVDGLSGRYTLRSYTYATYFDADGNLLEINTEGAAQVPEGYENAGRVVANSNSQEDSYFTDGGFEMVEGNPINGLDPIGIAEVRSFIRQLCDERGKTILISSHILSEISMLADDIGIIDHGALLEEESLAELEQKSSKHIHFTVSDAAQAARVLECNFHEKHFSVLDDHNLRLHNLALPVGKVVTAFVANGLEVSEAHSCEETLEDYFKRVTGGEGIA